MPLHREALNHANKFFGHGISKQEESDETGNLPESDGEGDSVERTDVRDSAVLREEVVSGQRVVLIGTSEKALSLIRG
jgi:hypothetical protein